MSTVKRRKVGKKKKQLLLGVGEYWMCEDKLLPMYSHLVDVYSDKLREEGNNVATLTTVKQEPEDVETLTPQHNDVQKVDNKEVSSFILQNVLILF